MIVIGVDVHKQSLTAVAVDELGRALAELTVGSSGELVAWSSSLAPERLWAVEDCRQLTRWLERQLLGLAEEIVRVPPKLTVPERRAGRQRGKSDPIDALAIARASLREPDLAHPRPDEQIYVEIKLLVDLLGKPIAESSALCIPTASYGHPMAGPPRAWNFISGQEPRCPMIELGWKSLGVLELTALPSIDQELWVPLVKETDALLVNGGDSLYLCHWMRESGLADLLPSLETVWVGLSAGSMVMTPRIGEDFVIWTPPDGGDEALGLVEFSIFPHVENPDLPTNTMAAAERWAAGLSGPAYAIDDETAIKVVDGTVEVVSEGHWKLFTRSAVATESGY